MNLSAEWVAVLLTMIAAIGGGLVWLVRLESKVNRCCDSGIEMEKRLRIEVDRVEVECTGKVDRIERIVERGLEKVERAIMDLANRMWDGATDRRHPT